MSIFGHKGNRCLVSLICLMLLFLSAHASASAYNGTLIVVNKKADTVSFIDLTSRTIIANRATGRGPHEVVISNDGKWAVVTDYAGGNSLSVFDVEAAKKVREIDLSRYPQPHGILFLADQRHVVVSSEGSDSVVIADIHSGQVKQAINTQQKGSHMVALSGDTKTVYTSNMGDNSVSEIALDSARVLRQIPMPAIPEAITINKSGSELWVGSNQDGLVTVFDVRSANVIKQWSRFSWPYRILLSLDETFAVVPDFRQDTLDIINARDKTLNRRMQFAPGTVPKGVAFYPDDRTLFLSAYGKNKVHVIDINSGTRLFTLETGEGPDGIGYSPLQVKLTPSE